VIINCINRFIDRINNFIKKDIPYYDFILYYLHKIKQTKEI